ncbi:Uncharacterized protein GBIM_10663 [Gryllus bimaculatus]|nr:Uncharacterized protein GBIM_10663 [Gryllus bimaculatus]
MATSDSEDFESADEDWEEGTDSVKENLKQDSTSIKAALNSKSPSVNITEEPSSEKIISKVQENLIQKPLEKKVIIQETKLETRAIHTESTEEEHVIKNLKQVSLAEGDNNSVKVDNKKISSNGDSDKETKQSDPYVMGDHSPVVKCASSKPLPNEDVVQEVKHSETLVKTDSKYSEVGQDIKFKSKKCETDSNVVTADSVLEGETDGWECEDEDLIDDLIAESSSDIKMDSVQSDSVAKEKISDGGKRDSDSNIQMDAVLNKLSDSVENKKSVSDGGGSWAGWGSWGVTSLLSTATESVSTLTNQVSQGLSTVLETGLGVPDPEELAKQQIEEEKKLLVADKERSELEEEEKREEESSGLFGFGRVISGVSKLVETASTKVVSGGLDTLETIGKKTMEVLQEGDPGLRKKRAIFSDKVVLSQILREAKDKAELEDKAMRNTEEARKVHFETLFDDYHGLVHLEALEMLSKQCNIKLQSVLINTPSSDVADLQESIAEIKDLCQLPDEEDAEGASFETLEVKLADIGKGLGVPVANQKLIKTWQEIDQWLQECRNKQRSAKEETVENAEYSAPSAQEIHQKAIGTLARLTAEAVEQFHKTAELLLVYEKRNPCEEAKILLEMTSVFSLQVSTSATVFSENLNTCSEYAEKSEIVNSHITNVFLEAANSSSYIQEAFQLLIPVLQVGAVLP